MMLPKLMHSSLARGATSFLGSNMVAVALQAVQFVLLARLLGAHDFGQLAALNAVAAVLLPVAGWGMGSVMLMEVSRSSDAPLARNALGNALLAVLVTGVPLVIAGCLAATVVFEGKVSMVLSMALLTSEVILLRVHAIAAQFCAAKESFKSAAGFNALAALTRLCATLVLLTGLLNVSAQGWSVVLVIFAAISSACVVWVLFRLAGGLGIDPSMIRSRSSLGAAFAFGTTAKAIYTDADKIMLGRFERTDVTGAYASAYRLVTIAFLPVRSLLDASAARFFRSGEDGMTGTFAFAVRLVKISLPYAVIASVLLYLCAPVIHWVLGESFRGAAEMLRVLCFLPIIQSIHYVFADALTGAGRQGLRSLLQGIVVAVYVVLGLAVIPLLGWKGAAYVCLVSETIFACLVVGAAFLARHDFMKSKEDGEQ